MLRAYAASARERSFLGRGGSQTHPGIMAPYRDAAETSRRVTHGRNGHTAGSARHQQEYARVFIPGTDRPHAQPKPRPVKNNGVSKVLCRTHGALVLC